MTRVAVMRQGPRALRPSAILDAAIDVFLEHGFANASMAEVAARARASKATIYNHFGSKEQLLAAIVDAMAQRIIDDHGIDETIDIRTNLIDFGRALLDLVLDPRTMALHRVVIAEAPRMPDIGPTYYQHGPQRTLDLLVAYLQRMTAAGTLACDDPEEAAMLLAGMIVGLHWQRAIIGAAPPLADAARAPWVTQCVDLFLARYGAGDRAAS
ncbi:MAG: TetR/AcrR family transcriptional regulator [Sphingomonas sp.]